MGNDKLTPSEISLFSMLCCQAFLWPSSVFGGRNICWVYIHLSALAAGSLCYLQGKRTASTPKREKRRKR